MQVTTVFFVLLTINAVLDNVFGSSLQARDVASKEIERHVATTPPDNHVTAIEPILGTPSARLSAGATDHHQYNSNVAPINDEDDGKIVNQLTDQSKSTFATVPFHQTGDVTASYDVNDDNAGILAKSVGSKRSEDSDMFNDDGGRENLSASDRRSQPVVEVEGPPDIEEANSDGWESRYDEHGNKIWFRSGGGSKVEDIMHRIRNIELPNAQYAQMISTTPFPLIFKQPVSSTSTTKTPPNGYWLVDEEGHHIWYRMDSPGIYVRDPTVKPSPKHSKPEIGDRLSWSGIGTWYYIVDPTGKKIWYQLLRGNDGEGQLVGRHRGSAGDDTKPTSSVASVGNSADDNAPHVYLSSGPGGRGGYWDIDEHGHYVWHHYVSPNVFIKDESTATDVLSVPVEYEGQLAQQQQQQQQQKSERNPPTDQLRRRIVSGPTGRNLAPNMRGGRQGRPPFWNVARPTTGLVRQRLSTENPLRTTVISSPDVDGADVTESESFGSNKGYWVVDENGEMTWFSYISDKKGVAPASSENTDDSVLKETLIDSDNNIDDQSSSSITTTPSPTSEKIPVSTRSAILTKLSTASSSFTSRRTSATTLATKTTATTAATLASTKSTFKPETRDPEEIPNGHWVRGEFGKWEWHKFGPSTQSTLRIVYTPSTSSTLSDRIQTTIDAGSRNRGRWTFDELGRLKWRRFDVTDHVTQTATPKLENTKLFTQLERGLGAITSSHVVDPDDTLRQSTAAESYTEQWTTSSSLPVRSSSATPAAESAVSTMTSVSTPAPTQSSTVIVTDVSLLELTTPSTLTSHSISVSEKDRRSLKNETDDNNDDDNVDDDNDDVTGTYIFQRVLAEYMASHDGNVDESFRAIIKRMIELMKSAVTREYGRPWNENDQQDLNKFARSINDTQIRQMFMEAVAEDESVGGDAGSGPRIDDVTEERPETAPTTRTTVAPRKRTPVASGKRRRNRTSLPTPRRNIINHRTTVTPLRRTQSELASGNRSIARKGDSISRDFIKDAFFGQFLEGSRSTKTADSVSHPIDDVTNRLYTVPGRRRITVNPRRVGGTTPLDTSVANSKIVNKIPPVTVVAKTVTSRPVIYGRYEDRSQNKPIRPTESLPTLRTAPVATNRALCKPLTPLEIVFTVDQRSPVPTHASHLWHIVFTVTSALRPDDRRVIVRFVPDMMKGGSPENYQKTNTFGSSIADRPKPAYSAVAGGVRSVGDIVDELTSTLRQKDTVRRTRGSGRLEKLRRYVGIYITDGRSPDTASTVLSVEQSTYNLGRKVDLIAVGVGPEVSVAQLITIVRGRRDKLLTAYTGSAEDTSFVGDSGQIGGIPAVAARLVNLLCDGGKYHDESR